MKTQPERSSAFSRLLQDELEAVESYELALSQLAGDPQAEELRRFELEHRAAAQWLEQRILQIGGKPATPRPAPARAPISTLWLLLAALVGGGLMLLLFVLTGNFITIALLFTSVFIALGFVHYWIWGRRCAPTRSAGNRP